MKRNSFVLLLILFLTQSVFAQKASFFKIVERKDQKRVDVLINDSLFTSLLYADSLKKHVLYPINASGGITVTRGYPINPKVGDQIDHPHQIGLWMNYGDVNGADYWNNSTKIDTNKKAYGTIKVNKVIAIKSGKGGAALTVLSTWINPGSKPVLAEETNYIFQEENEVRFIKRQTKLTAITDVLFKDNKEGLFGMRVSRQLEHPSDKATAVIVADKKTLKVVDKDITTGFYESSKGITGEAVFGTRAEWLKLSGKIDEKPIVLVLMDHPKNVNYPGFLMARGYGLFAINPLGSEVYTEGKEKLNFSLKKGESATFNYEIAIGSQLNKDRMEKLYHSFIEN